MAPETAAAVLVRAMTDTQRRVTVLALLLAMAMGAIEITVVSTTMPTVVHELGNVSLYSWVFTSYLLASTATMPVYGRLSDLYGRKPMMLIGFGLFSIGSLASGQSSSLPYLIAFRALQGLGAGALQTMPITILGDLYDLRGRARIQALAGAVWAVAALSGPLLGALTMKVLSWRWIFFWNVPFAVFASALLLLVFRETAPSERRHFDVAGAGLAMGAVVACVAAAQGLAPFVLAPVGVVMTVVFVRVERRSPEPLLPLHLLGQRTAAVVMVAAALTQGVLVATIAYLPLFTREVSGGSATEAGTAIAGIVLAWPLAAALASTLLRRVGARSLVRVGLLLVAVATTGLALLVPREARPLTLGCVCTALGVGMGLASPVMLITVQSMVGWERRGAVTAAVVFAKSIAGTLSVGALGAVLGAAVNGSPSAKGPTQPLGGLLPPSRSLLEHGLGRVFLLISALALAAFVASLLWPPAVEGSAAISEQP